MNGKLFDFVNADFFKPLTSMYKDRFLDCILRIYEICKNEFSYSAPRNEIVDDLTANFTTTDYNSYLVSKLSIMGSFKKYFDYVMHIEIVCGSPYIILEGTEDDYKSIISKAKKLRKYEFEWYIDRIIPCVEKLVEAKKGNIDIEFFKNIIQYQYKSDGICGGFKQIFGWIIKFLYRQEKKCSRFKKDKIPRSFHIKKENKEKDIIEDCMDIKEFNSLASQMLIVPFKVIYEDKTSNIKEEFDMKYKVGFIGCGQNEKSEVYPVQGWIVYLGAEEEKEYSDNNSPKFSLNGSYRTPDKFLI
jgi:hypothetical protein